jgi:hypothetical protein
MIAFFLLSKFLVKHFTLVLGVSEKVIFCLTVVVLKSLGALKKKL